MVGYSMVDIITDPLDGRLLIAEGEAKKGGAYIARITGTDKKFKYQREFISEKEVADRRGKIVRAKVRLSELQEPFDLLEIRAGGSWKQEYRNFYLYRSEDGTVSKIEEKTLREFLSQKIAQLKEETHG